MNPANAQSILDTSAQMAAAGRYRAATALLDTLPDNELTTPVRLLRAKILAQQGEYQEAVALWQEVLAGEPTNQEARRGVERAEEMASGKGGNLYLRANLCYGILVLVILGLTTSLAFVIGRNAGLSEIAPAKSLLKAQEEQLQFNREAVSAINHLGTRLDGRTAEEIKALESELASLEAKVETAARERHTAEKNLGRELALLNEQLASATSSAEQGLGKLGTLLDNLSRESGSSGVAVRNQLDQSAKQIAALEKKLQRLDVRDEVLGKLSEIKEAAEARWQTLAKSITEVDQLQLKQQADVAALQAKLAAASDTLLRAVAENRTEINRAMDGLRHELRAAGQLVHEIRWLTEQCGKISSVFGIADQPQRSLLDWLSETIKHGSRSTGRKDSGPPPREEPVSGNGDQAPE